ncbi:MAG: hypothetical protein NC131_17800, partial [Roseburia sp.]|nr:hypothetical protein [Roseburia sp.]
MIKDIRELNFPKKDGKQYATLTQATVSLQDMAEKTISAQVKIDGQITPDFSYDWEVEFRGEKYIMPLRLPQGAKENTSTMSTIDLTFHHWAIYQLKRWYFFTAEPVESGTAVPDKYIASVALNLVDFCALLDKVLEYYYGDKIRVSLDTEWAKKSKTEPTKVEISHSFIWDVLIKLYELYGVRWQIAPKSSGNYISGIRAGSSNSAVSGNTVSFDLRVSQDTHASLILANHEALRPGRKATLQFECSGLEAGTTFALGVGGQAGFPNTGLLVNGTNRVTFEISDAMAANFPNLLLDDTVRSVQNTAVRLSNFTLTTEGDMDHYEIKIGYPTTEISHIFEYGFEGGLQKVERQVQDDNIRNMIIGRGGSKNLPYRYYKDTDKENDSFPKDPDWVPELANMPFTELRGATFRSYVQGWNHRLYRRTKVTSADKAYAPWAWMRGYTDTRENAETGKIEPYFNPVEYVADEFTSAGNGYAVASGSSIARYGSLLGGLDNNDEIFPTLQGVIIDGLGRVDETVDVEKIESDDVAAAVEYNSTIREGATCEGLATNVPPSRYMECTAKSSGGFTVNEGKTANLLVSVDVLTVNDHGTRLSDAEAIKAAETIKGTDRVKVFNAVTGEEHSASGIPPGSWRYEVSVQVHNMTSDRTLNITVGDKSVHLMESESDGKWHGTWDIWIKNIWQSEKRSGETDEQYAARVWGPILGDHVGKEAKIVFSDGWLSTSEDYEFTIVSMPQYDPGKKLKSKDGKTYESHWRISLAKSDADLESTGLYVPSKKLYAEAGDHFFFIGIDMPYQYVIWAEERLDDWKKDHLRKVADIKPTWVIGLDKVRIHNYGRAGALVELLVPGNSLRLSDKRFVVNTQNAEAAYETLYLQSVTYTYNEPTESEANLLPDVEVVVGNEYAMTASAVATLQGEVSALQRQIGSMSNIEQVMRALGDMIYMRKDGVKERSVSPTEFANLLTSTGFRQGMVGGKGWGFYKDENGNWVLETDRIDVRQEMQVNTLVINQAEGRGGMEIDTGAFMEVTEVEEREDEYICRFDQKEGTVANLFHVGDIAYCNRWTAENADLKYYKRRIVDVGADYVALTKGKVEDSRPEDWPDSGVDGSGEPAKGDIIIHFGSYTDERRQYVKVRDVIGGGYERYVEELNSVKAKGVEYHFVGKQAGKSRWFVGNKDLVPYSGKGDGSYIEFLNGRFNLHNVALSIGTTIGDKPIGDYVGDAAKDA